MFQVIENDAEFFVTDNPVLDNAVRSELGAVPDLDEELALFKKVDKLMFLNEKYGRFS